MEECVCGHVADEHRSGWGYDCLVADCDCDRFDGGVE